MPRGNKTNRFADAGRALVKSAQSAQASEIPGEETKSEPTAAASKPAVETKNDEYQYIPAKSLKPSPFNEGMPMDESTIQSYVASMSDNGLIQPISVYNLGDGTYEIISGHQRYEAWCTRLHHDTIPAVVRKFEPDIRKRFSAHTEANTKSRNLDGRFWYSRIQAAEKIIADTEGDLPRGKVMGLVCEMLGFNSTQYRRYTEFGALTGSIQALDTEGIINVRKAILANQLTEAQQDRVAELTRILVAEKKAKSLGDENVEVTAAEFERIINKVLGGKERKAPERVTKKVKMERAGIAFVSMFNTAMTTDEANDALSVIESMRIQLDEAEKRLKERIGNA